VIRIDVLANDSDPDGNLDPASLSIVVYPPRKGYQSLQIINGLVKFTAPANFVGTATFLYQVCDTRGACGQASVTVTFPAV
jgi:hypothetical protein